MYVRKIGLNLKGSDWLPFLKTRMNAAIFQMHGKVSWFNEAWKLTVT